jgi:hypothetical protein
MYFADTGPAAVIGNTVVVETVRTRGIVVRIPTSLPWAKSADKSQAC